MSRLKAKFRLAALTAIASAATLLSLHTLLVLEPLPPVWVSLLRPVDRDVADIAREGILRVALCQDDVGYFEDSSGAHGLAFEIASRVARRLGVQLVPVVTSSSAAGLRQVLRGRADLLAVIDAGPAMGPDRVAWTAAFEQSAPVVLGPQASSIRTTADLRGKKVAVIQNSALEELVRRWRSRLADQLEVDRLPTTLSQRELVAGAARGAWPLIVMEADRARLEATLHEGLTVSPPLDAPLPVRWATRPNSPQLNRLTSRVLEDMRVLGVVAELQRRYLENPARLRDIRWARAGSRGPGLSPWDDLFQRAAEHHGLDWRLLAAVSFAESRHDPAGVGPGGSVGLLQLMPQTAQEFGAQDPYDPAQNVDAGARCLRWLYDIFAEIPREEDRLSFALAAYNMGIAHVDDARALAAARGLDPDRWDGEVAAILPALEDPETAAQLTAGMAKGNLTQRYVQRVLGLYRSYTGTEIAAQSAPVLRAAGS
jgi:membrane-bound lytic murein transglycosylase F